MMKKTTTALIAISILIALNTSAVLKVHAQPGLLDPTFGNGGIVTTDFGGLDDFAISAAIQSDGKLVEAGYSYNGSDYDVAVVRYNSDGSLDSTFGSGGKVTTPVGSSVDDFGTSIVLQNDGKLVVGGYSHIGYHNHYAAVRYNSDGSLDNTFGTGGMVTTLVTDHGGVAFDAAIQSDGKIILAGYADDAYSDFWAMVRYNSDGTIDSTFDEDGIVTKAFGFGDDQIYAIAIQSDGKIVAAGYSYNDTDWDFAIGRYNVDGSPDNSFGTNGVVTTDFNGQDEQCYGVAIQPDGKIVGAGYTTPYVTAFAIVRYNTNGTLDNTFGSGGKVSLNVGAVQNDDGTCVAIQSNGRIVMGGNALNGSNDDFGLIRFNSDGVVDSTFGTDGIVITPIGSGNDICLSLNIQTDGKIVAAGFSDVIGRDFAIVRYNGDAPNGISENAVDNVFTVTPNPFTDEIVISGIPVDEERGSNYGEVIVFDAMGKEVLKEKTFNAETRISTTDLLPGSYLIRFFNGNRTVNIKASKL